MKILGRIFLIIGFSIVILTGIINGIVKLIIYSYEKRN